MLLKIGAALAVVPLAMAGVVAGGLAGRTRPLPRLA